MARVPSPAQIKVVLQANGFIHVATHANGTEVWDHSVLSAIRCEVPPDADLLLYEFNLRHCVAKILEARRIDDTEILIQQMTRVRV